MLERMKQTQRWWLMGAMLVIAAVLIIGIYPSGWLDVALGDSDALGLIEVGSPV